MNKPLSSYFNKKLLLCVYTGFCSGLPFFIIIQLLPAWLRVSGVDLKTIGFFTLTQLPYLLKFLWSPWLDKISPFSLGYRKGWILVTQLALLIIIPTFGLISPQANINIIILLSLFTSLISATQDIAIDAYRREILTDEELGTGNSIHINAYRIAGFIPGGLSLIIAHYVDWFEVYLFTAAFIIPLLIITIKLQEPSHPKYNKNGRPSFKDAIREFFYRSSISNAICILIFIALYKLGDSLATSLATTFYLDMNFDTQHIGTVAKNAVVWPSIIGAFLGATLITKFGLNRALWISGFVQAFSILGFVWIASKGPFTSIGTNQLLMLATVISVESIGVGMGSAALVTYIAKNTNPLFTATQFALFTGVSALPRSLLNAISGILSSSLGWTNFFWLCTILAIPGMLLLFKVAPWHVKE
ncbi:AmpG family muropeptide MFS transporter [Orbus wheelerorum]|uniref:AmpG family muropeptide MFS transporter n=1 Tax=Orbus wheelerorum TaxID=3074111 RepID=UPI00370D81DB